MFLLKTKHEDLISLPKHEYRISIDTYNCNVLCPSSYLQVIKQRYVPFQKSKVYHLNDCIVDEETDTYNSFVSDNDLMYIVCKLPKLKDSNLKIYVIDMKTLKMKQTLTVQIDYYEIIRGSLTHNPIANFFIFNGYNNTFWIIVGSVRTMQRWFFKYNQQGTLITHFHSFDTAARVISPEYTYHDSVETIISTISYSQNHLIKEVCMNAWNIKGEQQGLADKMHHIIKKREELVKERAFNGFIFTYDINQDIYLATSETRDITYGQQSAYELKIILKKGETKYNLQSEKIYRYSFVFGIRSDGLIVGISLGKQSKIWTYQE